MADLTASEDHNEPGAVPADGVGEGSVERPDGRARDELAGVVVRNQRTIAGGSVVEGPPKTKHGFRTLSLDGQTVAALRS